jgi:hypothetical protein
MERHLEVKQLTLLSRNAVSQASNINNIKYLMTSPQHKEMMQTCAYIILSFVNKFIILLVTKQEIHKTAIKISVTPDEISFGGNNN